ncbi:MAG: bZIP transcription factor [Actinomycetota bacterium]
MSDEPQETTTSEPDDGGNLKRRLILGAAGVAVAVIAWFVGAAVLPRWWAQRIGDAVDGRITVGSFLGLSAGIIFTMLALLVLWLGFRFRSSRRRAILTVVLAVLVASPNLLTLGIVIGDGSAAHAGERILDVDGPGFRGGTLVGAILGTIVAAMFAVTARSRRRNKERVAELRRQADELER